MLADQHTGFLFSFDSDDILVEQYLTLHRHASTPHHSLQPPHRAQEPPLKIRLSFVLCEELWIHTTHNSITCVWNGCAFFGAKNCEANIASWGVNSKGLDGLLAFTSGNRKRIGSSDPLEWKGFCLFGHDSRFPLKPCVRKQCEHG